MSIKNTRAIIFFGGGPKYIDLVAICIRESQLPPYPIFLITDTATDIGGLPAGKKNLWRESPPSGKARENQVFLFLPAQKKKALLPGAGSRRIRGGMLGF